MIQFKIKLKHLKFFGPVFFLLRPCRPNLFLGMGDVNRKKYKAEALTIALLPNLPNWAVGSFKGETINWILQLGRNNWHKPYLEMTQ